MRGHIDKFELNGLEIGNGLPKLLSLLGIANRIFNAARSTPTPRAAMLIRPTSRADSTYLNPWPSSPIKQSRGIPVFQDDLACA